MKTRFQTVVLLAASCLIFGLAQASTQQGGEAGTEAAPSALEKTGKAIERGAKAAAGGIERGTKAAVGGVKHGAKAAANGIERGARATGKAAHKVAKKIGVSRTPDSGEPDGKP